MEEKTQSWDMFVRESKINKDVIEKEGKKVIITGFKGLETRKTQEGEEYTKAIFVVQYPNGNEYEYELSETSARIIQSDFLKAKVEVKDGSSFVGTKILLTPKEKGNFKWIEPGVIDLPKK